MEVAVSEAPAHNRIWYRVGEVGLHPFRRPAAGAHAVPGAALCRSRRGAHWWSCVPFTDVRARPGFASRTYRYYYSSAFWVGEVAGPRTARSGTASTTIARISATGAWRSISGPFQSRDGADAPELEPERKRLEVDLARQWVMAYQDDTPVFMSRASTGLAMGNGESMTPRGRHKVFYKRPSRHMAAGDSASDGYDLPGVPWCSYFTTTGVAFHGTYWHNDFGRPRSHGCINLALRKPRAGSIVGRCRWHLPASISSKAPRARASSSADTQRIHASPSDEVRQLTAVDSAYAQGFWHTWTPTAGCVYSGPTENAACAGRVGTNIGQRGVPASAR